MEKGRRKSGRLQVFKGRKAKLNHAIFHILALKGPLTIYDVYKRVRTRRLLKRTRYATVNKRVRSLEESGYIKKIGIRKTKAGFGAAIYELAAKAYLATMLDSIDLEDIIMRVDEATASAIIAAIAYTTESS